jgi:hypothetical protein
MNGIHNHTEPASREDSEAAEEPGARVIDGIESLINYNLEDGLVAFLEDDNTYQVFGFTVRLKQAVTFRNLDFMELWRLR